MDDLRKCIYCRQVKPVKEFSLEHIFPDALGGALCDMTFKTHNVCQRCNSLCGIWVDSPVIKNWFSNNYNFDIAREFIDFNNGSVLPLMYMGEFTEFSSKDEVCEMWLGPTGDNIYHFRKRSDPRYDTIIGGDFIDNKKNPGVAYIFATTDNPNWMKIVLLSFKEQFKNEKRISGNIGLDEESEEMFFHKPTEEEKEIITKLKAYNEPFHKLQTKINLGFDQRFLAKIALGIGFNLLGEDYLESEYALELHRCLWEKDFEKRCKLKVRGTGFLNEFNQIKDYMCYPGAHLINILSVGKELVIGLCLYGVIFAQIVICDDKKYFSDRQELRSGLIYLLFPQIKKIVGPISLGKYIACKFSGDKLKELEEIENCRIDYKKLPPFRSKDYK